MNLFYTAHIIPNDKSFILDETESKHAIKVLRLGQKDIIHLIDGKGHFYEAEIIDAHPKKCEVKINQVKKEEKPKSYIHIAIAPTKNTDRIEWFVEKVTEIGISEITPIVCDHSERKVLKTDRLEKRAIAAMKQSLKAFLPKINEAISLKDFIQQTAKDENKMIAHCYQEEQKHLKEVYKTTQNCIILIGPEGDFSQQEVELAMKNNFTPISLGASRLRTETAGMVACHTINLLNE
ncbi:MAG: 16S rRNA (uracil(1498)-N(3))-methyltransferase [Flavobacteriales bacterium]|nr:16S rRNA (uracil(1498)-N(3))-methyltransferase [Flavobacteriales bacterium]MCB9334876.1 16S rRNA (uracil(1498)-N(3))-methyltransferase [Flavobacteriales bacterium]